MNYYYELLLHNLCIRLLTAVIRNMFHVANGSFELPTKADILPTRVFKLLLMK